MKSLSDRHGKQNGRLIYSPRAATADRAPSHGAARCVGVSDQRTLGSLDSSAIDRQNRSELVAKPNHVVAPHDAMNQLQQAAIELRLDDLKNMIRHGGDLHGTLLAASSAHDPDPTIQVLVIRYLLQCGVAINETDKNGVTPLHRAVRFRSPAAVKELIAHGADINAVDKKSKSTSLHRAVTNTGAPATAGKMDCAIEIATLLLSNGADPRIKNKNGKTPIDYAKNSRMKDVLRKHDAT